MDGADGSHETAPGSAARPARDDRGQRGVLLAAGLIIGVQADCDLPSCPAGYPIERSPGLVGVEVTVNVHDGGRGPVSDTYAHNGISYPIIGGPGITIR